MHINSRNFYAEYHGHTAKDLRIVCENLRVMGKTRFVFLAGDSSLDSKHWFQTNAPACNGYENFLQPPVMRQDICYHLNKYFEKTSIVCVNAAVEEATVCEKIGETGQLNAQDMFIRNNITSEDVLFVSIGGNDIALKPSFATLFNMGKMMTLNKIESLENDFENCWGAPHFIEMYRDYIQDYVKKLIGNVRPKLVIISMIYYPSLLPGGWASGTLEKLNYHQNPLFLQTAIKQIYNHAIRKISLGPNVAVATFPMFEVLDGRNPDHYCQGVEPSAIGNKALAKAVVERFF